MRKGPGLLLAATFSLAGAVLPQPNCSSKIAEAYISHPLHPSNIILSKPTWETPAITSSNNTNYLLFYAGHHNMLRPVQWRYSSEHHMGDTQLSLSKQNRTCMGNYWKCSNLPGIRDLSHLVLIDWRYK